MEDRILQRVTTPTMSEYYDTLHRGRGVNIHTNTGVTGFSGDGKVEKCCAATPSLLLTW
ncbi:MAG: hypothetical protein CM15mP120_13940 [Pseudomonadota bacterium]|nr:MAG: hypothetical protein CM15mP120_13940 [Pseudomonadota bacterium]